METRIAYDSKRVYPARNTGTLYNRLFHVVVPKEHGAFIKGLLPFRGPLKKNPSHGGLDEIMVSFDTLYMLVSTFGGHCKCDCAGRKPVSPETLLGGSGTQ